MTADLALAIDVGGTTIKGELVEAGGGVLAARAAHTTCTRRPSGPT